jgi:carbamoyl-phosphate synthase small subunit
MQAILVLEDGKSFIGESNGIRIERVGEIIVNTGVVGYQEMITDPANLGKILVLTYPIIGNYGCAPKFSESDKVRVAGLVVKEESQVYSNWQAKESLKSFAQKNKLFVLHSLDTRMLAIHLRQRGPLYGVISTESFDTKNLVEKIRAFRQSPFLDMLKEVSVNMLKWLDKSRGKKIVILDLGATRSIIRQIERLGFSIILLPYNTTVSEVIKLKPKGLVIAGGPENIIELEKVAENIKPLLGRMPILGISSGSLVLALGLAAKLHRLKIGHRGMNYPVQNPASSKGEITIQNHTYAIDPISLLKVRGVKITGYNLNDRTVERFESRRLKIIAVQYIPYSPGCNEVNADILRFKGILKGS